MRTRVSPLAVAAHWASAGGGHVVAVLHFGSTRTGASPEARSAHDFFVIVDDYDAFYRAARPALGGARSARFLAWCNRALPPNVLHGTGPGDAEAKLFVLSERDLARAAGPRPKDHFVRARLTQNVGVVWARDDLASGRATALLTSVRRSTSTWMRPFLRGEFRPVDFARRMLEVSYASEIRPESAERVSEVIAAQRGFLESECAAALEEACREGRAVRRGEAYAYTRPAGPFERVAARAWLDLSRARATLRWAKYMWTFSGWLDYIAAKTERRTGVRVELGPRERRWPVVFLWPTFFRVMRARRQSPPRGAPPR
ncbi:MAG: hypothetical protein U0167_13295 [bacterium]